MRRFRQAREETGDDGRKEPEMILGEVSTVKEIVEEFTVYASKAMPRPVGAMSIDDLAVRMSEKGVPFTPKGCTRYSEYNIIEYQLDMTHSEHGYIIGILLSPSEKRIEPTDERLQSNTVSGIRCSIDYYGEESYESVFQRKMYANDAERDI